MSFNGILQSLFVGACGSLLAMFLLALLRRTSAGNALGAEWMARHPPIAGQDESHASRAGGRNSQQFSDIAISKTVIAMSAAGSFAAAALRWSGVSSRYDALGLVWIVGLIFGVIRLVRPPTVRPETAAAVAKCWRTVREVMVALVVVVVLSSAIGISRGHWSSGVPAPFLLAMLGLCPMCLALAHELTIANRVMWNQWGSVNGEGDPQHDLESTDGTGE